MKHTYIPPRPALLPSKVEDVIDTSRGEEGKFGKSLIIWMSAAPVMCAMYVTRKPVIQDNNNKSNKISSPFFLHYFKMCTHINKYIYMCVSLLLEILINMFGIKRYDPTHHQDQPLLHSDRKWSQRYQYFHLIFEQKEHLPWPNKWYIEQRDV